jgi:anti-sigma-K factor RskA
MSHEQFEEAVALYAIEAAEPEERQALEAHLESGCEDCRTALREHQAAAGLLPYALAPVWVPTELRSRLREAFLQGFANAQPEPTAKLVTDRRRGVGRLLTYWTSSLARPALAVASVVLLIGVGVYALTLRSQLEKEAGQRQQIETMMQNENARLAALQQQASEQEKALDVLRQDLADKLGTTRDALGAREVEVGQLRARVAQQQQEVAALNKALARGDEISPFLRSANIEVISLTGSDAAKGAGGLLLFDPDSQKALFYAFNMPPLPSGKTYQLWAILDKPISAGTFAPDAGNKTRLLIKRVPELTRINKFAVSLEPEGGRPAPTGPIYLSGQL